jgi:hypothetical protein
MVVFEFSEGTVTCLSKLPDIGLIASDAIFVAGQQCAEFLAIPCEL